ncbi:hypothetical protein [Mesobacillus campisalis]|nr:hypothetical protein [Mesobacillus campisalis]
MEILEGIALMVELLNFVTSEGKDLVIIPVMFIGKVREKEKN